MEYEKAKEAYRTATDLGASPDTEVKYAKLLLRFRQFKDAAAIIQRVLARNATDADAYRGLGKLHNAEKQYSQAESALRKAIEFNPDDPESHFAPGVALQRLGKAEGAMQEYALAAEKTEMQKKAARQLRGTLVPAGPGASE